MFLIFTVDVIYAEAFCCFWFAVIMASLWEYIFQTCSGIGKNISDCCSYL